MASATQSVVCLRGIHPIVGRFHGLLEEARGPRFISPAPGSTEATVLRVTCKEHVNVAGGGGIGTDGLYD